MISSQDEVDSVLIDYIQGKWEKERERIGKRRWINHWAIRISKLSNLRSRINLAPTLESTPLSIPTYTYTLTYTPIFKDVLQKSKQMVSRWGGKLYFVYLSGHCQYSTGKEDISRESVLRATTELGIPIIDIHEEVFVPHPDPLSLFPFRMDGHYNANGYRLVAEAIRSKLEADSVTATNSER